MKLLATAALLTATTVYAQVQSTTSADKMTVTHDVNFEGCHFTLTDPFKGQMRLTKRSKPASANYDGPLYQSSQTNNDLWIRFTCQKNSLKIIAERALVESHDGQWRITDPEHIDSTAEELKAIQASLVDLKGIGWSGAGATHIQSGVDEDLRTMSFVFCIPHNSIALCGGVESAAQLNNLKESAMPNIIKLLEGIEFVDDAETPIHAPASPH